MKHIHLLIFCLALTTSQLSAQQLIIKGKVSDQKTKEGIPFVNIGVSNSISGTSTDFEGFFELTVDRKLLNNRVQVSAVGYFNKSMSVREMNAQKPLNIELKPESYELAAVEINAEELFRQSILRKAAQNSAKNYMTEPYNYNLFYAAHERSKAENKSCQATALLYDASGYRYDDAPKAYSSRHFKITQIKRDFSVRSLDDGLIHINTLLEFDIVRLANNVLDPDHLTDFEASLDKQIVVYKGDSVWTLHYKCLKPELTNTGDYYATSYSGRVIINKNNYAVLQNKLTVEAANLSPLGRAFATDEKRISNVTYSVTTNYTKDLGCYRLDDIIFNREIKSKEGIVEQNYYLKVMEAQTSRIQKIMQQTFFCEQVGSQKFWESYKSPQLPTND